MRSVAVLPLFMLVACGETDRFILKQHDAHVVAWQEHNNIASDDTGTGLSISGSGKVGVSVGCCAVITSKGLEPGVGF